MYEPEVNLDELKAQIRLAVQRREAEGRTSFAKASAELLELLARDDFSPESFTDFPNLMVSASSEGLKLQPDFEPSPDDHYHVNDLLKYHDHQFVWNAYRALLKREPDEEGLTSYLQLLRGGRLNKIDVLGRLRNSPEGKRNNVTVEGLQPKAFFRRFYRVPVVGFLLEWVSAFLNLRSVVRNQRQLETHLIAQLDRTADYVNRSSAPVRELDASVSRALSELAQKQHELASRQAEIALRQHDQMLALLRRQNGHAGDSPDGEGLKRSTERPQVDTDRLYAAFQTEFRETNDESLWRYAQVLRRESVESDVLDVGCGSGGWLAFLRGQGIRARGVESNRILIAAAQELDLEVVDADALLYLRTLPENSLQAITAFHFVEHLPLERLAELLDQILRTLKPGGLLILETPNPKNLVVGACNFYSDPTHERPLFPETLQFILKHLGYDRISVDYVNPVEGSPFANGDEAARALHSWFFSARDYAVIAYKPNAEAPQAGSQEP